MVCEQCGAAVTEEQRFCNKCGAALKGGVAPRTAPTAGSTGMTGTTDAADVLPDPVADELVIATPTDESPLLIPALTGDDWAPPASSSTGTAGSPTTDPTGSPTTGSPAADATDAPATDPTGSPAADAPTTGAADTPTRDAAGSPTTDTTRDLDVTPAGPVPAAVAPVAPVAAASTTAPTAVTPTSPASTPPLVRTEELPQVFDGLQDVASLPEPRQTFRLRLVFVLAVLGAAAAVMSTIADITDLFTTRPIDGIDQGVRTLDDFGTNLAVAAYVGAGVMVFGGLLACFGFRWAAGLAGGAGLALVGWAGLVLGLAEIPIERATDITRNPTTPDPFTLTVTRDVGWWLVAGAAALGLLVFLASLRMAGTGRRRSLNPWIAAVGALSTLVLAVGPLIPTGNATFADNFDWSRSTLPVAIFAGRLVQVGLIAFAGVVGFLLVRAYGLGLAAGGVSVALWLWITALGEIGADPRGIADRNPGATDTIPHGVTTIGALMTITMIVIAAVVATVQRQRPAPRQRRPAPRPARTGQPVGV